MKPQDAIKLIGKTVNGHHIDDMHHVGSDSSVKLYLYSKGRQVIDITNLDLSDLWVEDS